jgi:hypothetical protein
MNDQELFARDDETGEKAIRTMFSLSRETIAANLDAIVELAGHPAPEVRAEALSTLFVRGKRGELRELAARALSRDADEAVRAAAAIGLAAISVDSTKHEDSRLLLRALRNTHETEEVRRCAYEGLLLMHGNPDFPSSLVAFDAREHVDWLWIDAVERTIGD